MAVKKRRVKKKRRKDRIGHSALIWIGYSTLILSLVFIVFNMVAPLMNHLPTALYNRPVPRKAAIVDQTATSYPNPEFINKAITYLTDAGFDVEVYEGKDVTVELYRALPTRGYGLIILRTHSINFTEPHGPVFLFTGEPYEKRRYVYEQLTDRIKASKPLCGNRSVFFAIGPGFVRQSMRGRFDGTLIIIGGCRSLFSSDLAEAFVERGASAVIGWDEWVDVSHNDKAIGSLLHALTAERLTIDQAVEKTMSEIGPDPKYESVLTYFLQERGDYAIKKA